MWSHVFILLGLYDVMRQYVVTRFYLTWAVRCHEAVCGHVFILLELYDVIRQYVVTRLYLTWAVRCHEAVCGHTFLSYLGCTMS